jgi:hypothetical protein
MILETRVDDGVPAGWRAQLGSGSGTLGERPAEEGSVSPADRCDGAADRPGVTAVSRRVRLVLGGAVAVLAATVLKGAVRGGASGRSSDDQPPEITPTLPRRALAVALAALVAASFLLAAAPGARTQHPLAAGASLAGLDGSAMAKMVGDLPGSATAPDLPKATTPPAPAPPSLAGAAPLRAHEIFGFAPYWTLDQSSGFDVGAMTTLAYFSVGVNPDGSLDRSDAGWNGYQSQALADLVTRAHGAGDRVVLTVSCFSQSALDALTSSPSAPTTLSSALVAAIEAKNLDGVNIDFEGTGSVDQRGLTNLITQVSAAVHAANPHYQVTMDTYASSAGDPGGFYDIGALAPSVDGFFVMAYQLNLQAASSASSPLTSSMYSDLTTVKQYTAVVPASKVILGVPFYGYDWPTTDGSLTAQSTGPPSTVAYSQIAVSGHPVYWDATTDTAWTSYQVGTQWHETFFEDPSSLYLEAQLAQFFDVAGLGIWALGFDGNSPQMLGALAGFAPATKDGVAGPAVTPSSGTTPAASPATTGPPTVPATSGTVPQPADPSAPTAPAPVGVTTTTGGAPSTTTSSAPAPGSTTTSSTDPGGGGQGASMRYSGVWQGQTVELALVPAGQPLPTGSPVYLGQLTGFQTNDPTVACLAAEAALDVWQFSGEPALGVVVTQQPNDCATANLTFSLNVGFGGAGQSPSAQSIDAPSDSTPLVDRPG